MHLFCSLVLTIEKETFYIGNCTRKKCTFLSLEISCEFDSHNFPLIKQPGWTVFCAYHQTEVMNWTISLLIK